MAVHEDWPGGAGNGLGTLYAFQKAVAKVRRHAKGGQGSGRVQSLMRNCAGCNYGQRQSSAATQRRGKHGNVPYCRQGVCELKALTRDPSPTPLASQGTRLAPLPGSESNNKPAVALPGVVCVHGAKQCMTILEAVGTAGRRGWRSGRNTCEIECYVCVRSPASRPTVQGAGQAQPPLKHVCVCVAAS